VTVSVHERDGGVFVLVITTVPPGDRAAIHAKDVHVLVFHALPGGKAPHLSRHPSRGRPPQGTPAALSSPS